MAGIPNSSNSARTHERLWTPVFVLIVACTLCGFLVGQGLNAGTSVYLERIGGSVGLAGIGALCFSVSAAVARVVSGPLIDTRGRRIILLWGGACMLVGTIGPLVANTSAVFVAWRVLQGVGFSAVTTASATAAADVLPASRLGEGIGYYGLGQAISMSIGPALAIFLVSTDPPSNFYVGTAVCSALVVVLALAIRYEKRPQLLPPSSAYHVRWHEGTLGKRGVEAAQATEVAKLTGIRRMLDSIFEPGAIPATITIVFMSGAFAFNIFYMGVFGNHLGVANPGIYYTGTALVMIVVRLASGRFMNSAAPLAIMGVAVGGGLVAYGMLFACSLGQLGPATPLAFYAASIPFGLCMGLGIPINQTIAVQLSPPARWGAANALFMLGIDIGNGLLATLWGALAETVGFSVTIACVLVLLVLSFAIAWFAYPDHGRRPTPES